jgi:hypothetical protein
MEVMVGRGILDPELLMSAGNENGASIIIASRHDRKRQDARRV